MTREASRKIDPSFWLSLFFVAIIAALVLTAGRWPWDTRLFPWAIGMPALVLALWQLVSDWKGAGGGEGEEERPAAAPIDIPVDPSIPSEVMLRRTLRGMAWIVGFAIGIWFLGFLISIPVFVFSYLISEAQASRLGALALAAAAFLFVWGIFDVMMHIAWPEAVLFTMLRY